MRTINGPIQDFCHPITMLRKGSSWPRIETGRRIRSPVSPKIENFTDFLFEYFSNKREVWRVKLAVAKVRKVARTLLTLEEKDPKRLFEGNALLRRLVRIGVLPEDQMKLDYVLGLKIENFLERRLQTQGTDNSEFHEPWLYKSRTPTFINDYEFIR